MKEEVMTAFENFLNSNVGTIIVGCVGVLIIALIIFSKTSLGKRLFNKTVSEIGQIREIARSSNEKVNEVKSIANEKINELKNEYERKIGIVISYVEKYELEMAKIVNEIPNKKVQEKLSNFYEQMKFYRDELIEKYPTLEQLEEYKLKMEELDLTLEQQRMEVENTYKALLERLQLEYEERFKNLENKLYEERKDTNGEI